MLNDKISAILKRKITDFEYLPTISLFMAYLIGQIQYMCVKHMFTCCASYSIPTYVWKKRS